jgi:MFS transporter, DHA1 family, solute carrier family 18 (vesicular amine transporter), member 1/2
VIGAAAGRRQVFWTATGLIAVDTVLFTMVVPALPEFQDRYGFPDAVGALIFAAFPVGQLVTALVAAGLVERAGRRPVMIAAALVLALATLGFALAGSTALLVPARLVQGVAAGLVWTAGIAAISDVYPSDQLGFRIGLAETAGGATGLAGPLLGGVLIDAFGLDAAFFLATALPVLVLVPALAVPETRGAPAGRTPGVWTGLRRLAREPGARAGAAALAAMAGVLALAEPLLPLDLSHRLDLSPVGVGAVFAAGLLAYYATVPPAGRWSDRRGRRAPTVAGGLVVVAGLPFTAHGPAWAVAIAFAVVGAGIGGLGASSGALMVEAVDRAGMAGRYGLSAAVLTVVFSLGYVLGPLLGAAASALTSWAVTTVVAAVMVLAVTAWCARALAESDAERPG